MEPVIPGSSRRPRPQIFQVPHHSSSESNPSDHDSIYKAMKADSGAEESYGRHYSGSSHQNHEYQGSEMGGNIAMILSASPETPAAESHTEQKKTKLRWRRSYTLPANWLPSKVNDPLADIVKDAKTKVNTLRQWGHRRALSLGDVDNRLRKSRWAATLISPVRPFLPKYPPPVRSPTPPGLPSFGSPEAISYTTQFCVRSSVPNGHGPSRSLSALERGCRRVSESYANQLRRLFGVPLPPAPPTNRCQGPSLPRAEDGTAVQGRFPYRSSGHGVNVARRLEDHPFHQAAPPVTESETAYTDDRPHGQGRRSRRERHEHHDNAKDEHLARARPQDARSNRMSRQRFANVRSSVPTQAMPTLTRRAIPLPPPIASPASNSYHSCMSQPPNSPIVPTYDGEIDFPGAGRTREPFVNTPSRMQAVRHPESIITEDTLDIQGLDFWRAYEKLSRYFPCCCPTNDGDDDGYDNDVTTSGQGSRSSNETYMTAQSRFENNNIDNNRFRYQHHPSPEEVYLGFPRLRSAMSERNQLQPTEPEPCLLRFCSHF